MLTCSKRTVLSYCQSFLLILHYILEDYAIVFSKNLYCSGQNYYLHFLLYKKLNIVVVVIFINELI